MTKEVFAANLDKATKQAIALARNMLLEDLPSTYIYALCHTEVFQGAFDHNQLVSRLYNEGAVPEWINILVCDAMSSTIFRVECSEHTTQNESTYAGQSDGCPPFHVLAPALPAAVKNALDRAAGPNASYEKTTAFLQKNPFSIADSPSYLPLP